METKKITVEFTNRSVHLELRYESILEVLLIELDENSMETKRLIFTQPYKTNPDGSITEWQNAEEAFDWYNDRSREML